MRHKLGPVTAGLALCLAAALPGHAASPAEVELKADIDGVIAKLGASSSGFVRWDGADSVAIRPQGDGAVAEISNARITIDAHDAQPARITLDRVEISRASGPDNSVKLGIVLPRDAVVQGAKGEQTRLRLKDATANLVFDAPSGRIRATELALAGGRLEDKESGDWLSFGPLSALSKLVGTADGGWDGPISFELKGIEFFFTEAPVGGSIERIGYTAESAGPDFAALNRVRDRVEALQKNEKAPPGERLDALLESLSDLAILFSVAKGEMTMERLVARAPTGEPLVAFDSANIGGGVTGLAGDAAALRITIKHEGLALAPSILDTDKVPQRVVLDFGIEEVETAALRAIVDAARKLRGDAGDAARLAAQQQMLGAAARLHPVLRIYDLAVETPDVGVAATAELTGSPLAPKGYTAQGDVAVRGLDALPKLVGPAPFAEYLPLLNEIGAPASGGDGTSRVAFHLASAPPKWLTINGHDVSPWWMGGDSGSARPLRPAHPVMTGDDVRTVQRALASAAIPAPRNGRYDGATAVAVARFQKQSGLSVNGVVDAATRQKLGVKAEPAPPEGPRKPPGR